MILRIESRLSSSPYSQQLLLTSTKGKGDGGWKGLGVGEWERGEGGGVRHQNGRYADSKFDQAMTTPSIKFFYIWRFTELVTLITEVVM